MYCTIAQNRELVSQLYKEWTGKDLGKQIARDSLLIIAKEGSLVIGACQLLLISDYVWGNEWGLIENVYVTPHYRRRGVGKALMKFAETEAMLYGCEFVKLTSGEDKQEAHVFYEKSGYTRGNSYKRGINEP